MAGSACMKWALIDLIDLLSQATVENFIRFHDVIYDCKPGAFLISNRQCI